MKVPEEDMTIESLMRRDRLIVSIGLASISAVAWVYIFGLAKTMSGMDMTGMNMMRAAAAPDMTSWTLRAFLLTFIMWAVMMVAMMTPSAAPMVLQFAWIYRKGRNQH